VASGRPGEVEVSFGRKAVRRAGREGILLDINPLTPTEVGISSCKGKQNIQVDGELQGG